MQLELRLPLTQVLTVSEMEGQPYWSHFLAKKVVHDALNHTLRELTIIGTAAYRNIFPQVIALISSGRLPVEKLITRSG